MPKVVFQIEGGKPVTVDCNVGDNLLELARRANVAIDAPCSGNGSCGKCRVKLTEGTLDSLQSRHISQEEWDEGWRLSCCSKVNGDCTVLVPDIASAYQSRMKTADLSSPKEIAIFKSTEANLRASGIQFTNNFRSAVIAMAEPSPEDTMPDIERLTWAVEEALGVEKVEVPFCVMVKLAATLREFGWTVCVKGELAFRGKVGQNIEEKRDKKDQPYTVFSAFSAEKVDDGFEYQWVRFFCFGKERDAWLQPGIKVDAIGEMNLSAHNGKINLSCKVEELTQYVADSSNYNQ